MPVLLVGHRKLAVSFVVAFWLLYAGCTTDLLLDAKLDCSRDFEAEVCQVFQILNSERADKAMKILSWDPELALAAQRHAKDMFEQDYFSHTSLDGRNFANRVSETDYDAQPTGENIAYGYQTSVAVMSGWMNSSGHRANILSSNSTEVGVGYYENYWVQVFGRR